MRIDVKVIPGAKKNLIKKTLPTMTVYLTAPAVENKANKALINLLADQLDISKGRISILKGLKSRHKTLDLNGVTLEDIRPLESAAR